MTKNSGLADSPFFAPKAEQTATPSVEPPIETEARTSLPGQIPPSVSSEQAPKQPHTTTRHQKKKAPKQSRNRDIMTSRNHDVTTSLPHAIMVSCNQEMIAQLRSVVKQIGKEPTTCRLTTEEKKTLKMVEFEYSNRDIKTRKTYIIFRGTKTILQTKHSYPHYPIVNPT